jgi:hypothetical protein
LSELTPPAGKKITYWTLNGWVFRIIPVEAQDGMPPVTGWRHPNLLNRPWSFNVRQQTRFTSGYHYGWRKLPSMSQITSSMGASPVGCHATFAFFTRKILWTDGTALRFGKAGEISDVQPKTVKARHNILSLHHCAG